MSDLEQQIKTAAEKAVLKIISSGNWIEPDYRNRLKIPADFMQDVWALVDKDKIKQQMVERIETELANRIINHMAAELATDVKKILGDKDRRQAIRQVAMDHMDEILNP